MADTKHTRDDSDSDDDTTEQFSDVGLGKNALTAYLLGIVGGVAFCMMFIFPSVWHVFAAVCLFSVFHVMEFLMTCVGQPQSVSHQSFLLHHSREFQIATRAAFVEYILEALFFPSIKAGTALNTIAGVALFIALAGQVVRSLAMFTAGRSFTHLVQYRRRRGHALITDGVYAYIRHPAYLGWFAWAVGMQVCMLNPLCTVAYALVVHRFFAARVREEEAALVDMFGDEYRAYRARTPTYIPGIE